MTDDHDIDRLRTLTSRGDADAAERLRTVALRRELDADRRLATRVLVERGRWQLECSGHAVAFGAGRRRRGGGSFEAPYQTPAIEVYVGPRCVAVVAGRTSWCSGRVPARIVVETLREHFESNHTFDAGYVFDDAAAPARSLVHTLARAVARCRPAAPPDDDDIHGLRRALRQANQRLWTCNHTLGFPSMFGACVDAVVCAPPRLELAHVGLGTVVQAAADGAMYPLCTRQDEASRMVSTGFPSFNDLAPGQSWAQIPAAQLGQFESHEADWLAHVELELDLDEALLVVTDAVARRLRHGDVWSRLHDQPGQRACERLVALAAHEHNRWDGGAGAALVRLVPVSRPWAPP